MQRESAVLLGIYNNETIVLTKRSSNLRSFSGHVCLPGGGIDKADLDPTAAAIREFREEIEYSGLIEPLLCLQKAFSPGAEHFIYPVIAKLDGEIHGFNANEVEKIIYLRLSDLKNELFRINNKLPNIKYSWCFTYADEFVWGLTAYILKTYCSLLPDL